MPAPEPDFLLKLGDTQDESKRWRAALLSAVLHAVFAVVLFNVQFTARSPRGNYPEILPRQVTPLVAPPRELFKELTQRAPNTREIAKELDIEGLRPRPEAKKSPPPKPALSPKPNPGVSASAPSLPAPPKIELPEAQVAQLPPQGLGTSNLPPPPSPVAPPPERPKITFESVSGSGRGQGNTSGGASSNVRIAVPKGTVEEAAAAVARKGGGGMVIGDDLEIPSIGQSMSQQASPGKMGSQLELLSDPQGADFRPYLIRVLAAVRRNWFAVIPESARLGRRGKVIIQFSISRDGKVPKLVIAVPSGADPLDRAAVAGISASNPFPPLPVEFKGEQIRLQLSFVYNNVATLR